MNSKYMFKLSFLLILALCRSINLPGQDYASWGDLKSGKYKIGFRTSKTYDSTRSYNLNGIEKFRPILIHLWYPSNASEKNVHMPYKSYIALETKRENFDESSIEEVNRYCNQIIYGYLDYGKKIMGDLNITISDVLFNATASFESVDQTPGVFPLIIYAPSFGKSAIQNNIACEYLASHGYIVASAASAGENSQIMTSDEKGVTAQVQDMEHIVKYLRNIEKVNFSKIGTFGFSWGALSAIIHQMRNDYVKAVASWDGSIEYQGYEIARNMHDFKPEKFTVPFIFFTNKNGDWTEFSFYKSVASTKKYLYRLKRLDHAEFASYWTVFANTKKNVSTYDLKSYRNICEYTLRFFDIYVKGKGSMAPKLEGFDPEVMDKLKPD